jgi:hypothetical protein
VVFPLPIHPLPLANDRHLANRTIGMVAQLFIGYARDVPPKCDRKGPFCFSSSFYRARNLIERFFNRSSNVGLPYPLRQGRRHLSLH